MTGVPIMKFVFSSFMTLGRAGSTLHFQIILPESASKEYKKLSPPGKMTCDLPPTTAWTGFDHCPSMILSPGRLLCQATVPSSLRARKLGALGSSGLPVLSLTPLLVTRKSLSPATSGEELQQ